MAPFQFVPLGVGNAFSARYYSSNLAVCADDTWLLIDCAHPIRKVLREASLTSGVSLDLGDISALVLTHLHGDHASGLEMYGYFNHYALQRHATLLTHPEVAAHLWRGHLAASMEWSIKESGEPPHQRQLEDYFDLRYLNESQSMTVGPFTIECRHTLHSIPTIALRIHAGSQTLGYSADTIFDPTLIDWLSPADLIIHETGEHGPHTPYKHLAALDPELRAKMRLIHYADEFDVAASVIEPLEQGKLYKV